MRTLALLMGMVLTTTLALAHDPVPKGYDFTAGYDYYITPNEGNNYNDGQGFNVGLTHQIAEHLSGQALFKHITDVHFPVSDDPKGSFGELRGYGGQYNLMFALPATGSVDVYLLLGVGYYSWDFKENPFLQDNNVTVDTDSSLALEGGIGADYKVSDSWTVSGYVGWFDTNIDKDARDNTGLEWNILDDGEIGLQYIHVGAQAKYRF